MVSEGSSFNQKLPPSGIMVIVTIDITVDQIIFSFFFLWGYHDTMHPGTI